MVVCKEICPQCRLGMSSQGMCELRRNVSTRQLTQFLVNLALTLQNSGRVQTLGRKGLIWGAKGISAGARGGYWDHQGTMLKTPRLLTKGGIVHEQSSQQGTSQKRVNRTPCKVNWGLKGGQKSLCHKGGHCARYW